MSRSAIDALHAIDAKRSAVVADLKNQLLLQLKSTAADLNAIGGHVRIINTSRMGQLTDKPCKICGFATAPAHDGRKHVRYQKLGAFATFTAAELKDMGFKRIK